LEEKVFKVSTETLKNRLPNIPLVRAHMGEQNIR